MHLVSTAALRARFGHLSLLKFTLRLSFVMGSTRAKNKDQFAIDPSSKVRIYRTSSLTLAAMSAMPSSIRALGMDE